MTLLIIYLLIALVFSFLCSIAEAVMLSVTPAYVAVLEKQRPKIGGKLKLLRDDIKHPLAAILTLNTIAHTVGAAGVGAQAAVVFGNNYLALVSAVLTLAILFLSEIIPKTLGATYWRKLAPLVAYWLPMLIWLLWPLVKLSELVTGSMTHGKDLTGLSRQEFSVMADLSAEEGQIGQHESEVLKNLMDLRHTPVVDAMTPRTVVFSLPDSTTVEEFFHHHEQMSFSRIPVYHEDTDDIVGFVLRGDLLLAKAGGSSNTTLAKYLRDMPFIPETLTLSRAFTALHSDNAHMALVVDEYGDMQGILTLEDVLETLLGLEIVDESDSTVDMQDLAKRKWRRKAKEIGLDLDKDN